MPIFGMSDVNYEAICYLAKSVNPFYKAGK